MRSSSAADAVGNLAIITILDLSSYDLLLVLRTLYDESVERGSSVVECRARNRVSPGSNPFCYRFEDWAFPFSPLTPKLTQLYKSVPGYRQWWKCE